MDPGGDPGAPRSVDPARAAGRAAGVRSASRLPRVRARGLHHRGSVRSRRRLAPQPPVSDLHERAERLLERELERFEREHPRSGELARRARASLLAGVPMHWMVRWPGGYPGLRGRGLGRALPRRRRDRVRGLLPGGHGRDDRPLARARRPRRRRAGRPRHHADASERGGALGGGGADAPLRAPALAVRAHRHGREPLRDPARAPRHRPAEGARLQLVLPRHRRRDLRHAPRRSGRRARGNLGPPVPLDETTRVVEWNDVEALERELGHGDVACVLAEPALTNIGIVHAQPGFHDALRELTRETGTLLIIDETHTLCAGPGGYTREHGLEPDLLTVGKAIGSGIPSAAYGFTAEVADRVEAAIGPRRVRRRRRRRHARRERALSRRGARDPRARPHRGGIRADDRSRRALRAGRAGGDRRERSCPGTSPDWAAGSSTSSARSGRSPEATRRPGATPCSTGSSTSTRSTAGCS